MSQNKIDIETQIAEQDVTVITERSDLIVPETRQKAGKIKRTLAALVDIAIAALMMSIIPLVGDVAAVAYLLLRDGLDIPLMKGRSIGKTLLGIRPVDLNGRSLSISKSIKRNLPFAVGPAIQVLPLLGWLFGPLIAIAAAVIEVSLVFSDENGRRMGDKFAGTMVVDE
ncbi:MAG: RDD family protein [Rhodothermales bacterium]|nr:RDD family protein [Rhodothermales bacterium]